MDVDAEDFLGVAGELAQEDTAAVPDLEQPPSLRGRQERQHKTEPESLDPAQNRPVVPDGEVDGPGLRFVTREIRIRWQGRWT